MKKRSVVRLLTACTATSIAVSMTGSMTVKAAEAAVAENEGVNSDNGSADSSSDNTDNRGADNSSDNTDNGSADNNSDNTENIQDNGSLNADNGSAAVSNNEGDAVTLSAAPANNTSEKVETTTNVNEDGSITNTTTTTTVVTTVTEGAPQSVTETVEVQPGDAYYDETQVDSEGNEIHPEKAEVTTTSSNVTTTVATTVTTETATTSVVGWKTNAKDFSKKEVVTLKKEDNTVKTADAADAVETAAQNFLNSQNVAADYAVYADKLDNSIDHIDGNIAVDTLGCSETIWNKEQYGTETGSGDKDIALSYAQNGYSYVGKTEDGVQIRTNSCNQTVDGKASSLLVYGEEAGNSLKNNGNYTEENGTANHFGKLEMTSDMLDENGNLKEETAKELVESDSRLDDLAKVMDIDNNRQAIAKAGQALIEATNESDTLTDLQKIEKTAEIINSDMVEKDQIITITVGFSDVCEGELKNKMNIALNKLVTDNSSEATVVVNVAPGTEDLDISIDYQMDRTQNYNCRAANLFWNFGTYNGKITFTSGWSGNIVAPLAEVVLRNGIQSGRVIADTASTSGEIHMAVADSTEETVKTVEITSRDESTSVETKNETKSETSYTLIYPELPKETDKTENPKNPEKPEGGDENEKVEDTEEKEEKTEGGDENEKVEDTEEKEEKTEGSNEKVEDTEEKEEKTEGSDENKEDDKKEENKKTDNKDSSDNDDNTHNREESKGSSGSNGGSGNDGGKSTEVTTITITTPVVPKSVSFSSPEEANLMSLALATPGVPRSMKTGERAVRTGDDSNVILFGGMAVASLGALYVYIASRKKER